MGKSKKKRNEKQNLDGIKKEGQRGLYSAVVVIGGRAAAVNIRRQRRPTPGGPRTWRRRTTMRRRRRPAKGEGGATAQPGGLMIGLGEKNQENQKIIKNAWEISLPKGRALLTVLSISRRPRCARGTAVSLRPPATSLPPPSFCPPPPPGLALQLGHRYWTASPRCELFHLAPVVGGLEGGWRTKGIRSGPGIRSVE